MIKFITNAIEVPPDVVGALGGLDAAFARQAVKVKIAVNYLPQFRKVLLNFTGAKIKWCSGTFTVEQVVSMNKNEFVKHVLSEFAA